MEEDTVILEVGEKEYECSKSQLSDLSEYFRIMFTGGFAEKNMSKIKLTDVSVTSWEYIFNFLKFGYIDTDNKKNGYLNDMLELMQTANMLQLRYIEESCASIINDSLTTSNCLQIFEIIHRLEYRPLTTTINAFLLFYFDDVTKSDEFYDLSVDQLERYCNSAALYSRDGELGVWKAVERWMNFPSDSASRLDYTYRLVKCLRLKSMNLRDMQTLMSCNSIKRCPLVLKAIERIIESLTITQEQPESKKESDIKDSEELSEFLEEWQKSEPRKVCMVPCLVGNAFANLPNAASPFILRFCEKEKKISPLIKLENMETCLGTMVGFKVVSDGFKIFLVGGIVMKREREWNKAVWIYDWVQNSWSFFCGVSRPLRHMSVCLLHNYLYLIGGIGRHRVTQVQVSKLDLETKTWSDCASLSQPMYATPCVVFQNSIYLISSNIYRYDVPSNTWLTISYPTINVSEIGMFYNAVADDTYIYALGNSCNKLYKFDPTLMPVQLEFVGSFDVECTLQICLIGNYIYSFSQLESAETMFCKKMNIESGEVHNVYEAKTDSTIADIDARHQHGCFSFYDFKTESH